ncbi:MFS transporter [Falsiroseomonas sp. HC035]|uniref:MFS transporter n=1 Tax=Falsiroseomonas sp. HC035 TaxID=3390999 RepID=UPI003D317C67
MNPPIWLMALAAFTIGCGMRMLDPLLPMLAREFNTGLGAVAPLIGVFALSYGLAQLVIGPLGDRLGKMRVVALSLGLYAATLLAAAFAGGLSPLLVIRMLAGLAAAAVVPLLMAHIGDSVPYGQRQAVLGRFLTGMVAAQMLAGPLSGIVADFAGWRVSFLGLGVMATAITVLFVAWQGRALWQVQSGESRGIGLYGFLRILEKPAGRRLLLAAALNGMLLFGGAFPFIASMLIERFHLSAAEAGLVVASFGLGSLVYTRSAGWLIARLGERGMVLWGGGGVALALAAFALAPNWWVVALAQAVVGLLFFMLHGVLQARSTEALPEARGTAVSAFAMALFLGQSIGAVLFGTLIVTAGFTTALLVAAAGVLGLSLWFRGTLSRAA